MDRMMSPYRVGLEPAPLDRIRQEVLHHAARGQGRDIILSINILYYILLNESYRLNSHTDRIMQDNTG